MRSSRWLALLLALCLLSTLLPTALSEEELELQYEAADAAGEVPEEEAEEVLANSTLADAAGADEDGGLALWEETPDAQGDAPADEASRRELSYAKTKKAVKVYYDGDAVQPMAKLAKGEVVLVTGDCGDLAAVAVNASGTMVEGFVKRSALTELSAKALKKYLARIASGKVAVYGNDLNWPLGPLSSKSEMEQLAANAANYTELDNMTAYTINGVVIRAGEVPTKGPHNCWAWAQVIYKKIWGTGFESTFEGTASKGYNLARKLTDNERKLTPENLKHIVSNAKPGATIRVQACPSTCSGFNGDGCSKHNKHSLIIAEIRSDGFVTMDDQGTVPHTRFYTWQGFCNAWKNWVYVKYVKWPNAPALASSESQDGYAVTPSSETYRVRATASKGAGVYSLPSGGSLVAALVYPATFAASKQALKTIDGKTWVYGKSSTGATGWLAVTDAVAGSKDTIKVTGVTLSQSAVLLLKGGTATLTAAVAPIDATNQQVSWYSGNSGVVTVKDGVLTGVAGGSATITATTADGAKTATCQVQVVEADGSKALSKTGGNGTVKLPVGKKLQLLPTFATAKGWKVKGVSSSKSKYASVSKTGLVTAKKVGSTVITVKAKNGKKATLTVKVVKASAAVTPVAPSTPTEPTKVYLSKTGTLSLKVGKTKQLYAALEPAGVTSGLTWKSTNPKVAYIDENGKVYALKKGSCVVGVITDNGKYATVKVKVK